VTAHDPSESTTTLLRWGLFVIFFFLVVQLVDGRPQNNSLRGGKQIPTESEISRKLSKELARRGFKFCGPTIVYAFMQAVGMVNDHLITCHRHAACAALAQPHRH